MSTGLDTVLLDLLNKPFGPYLDETILSERCRLKRLQLENLMLSYDGKPTGFDRTEFTEQFVPSSVTHLAPIRPGSRVFYRGILSIQAVTHISDKGIESLDAYFRERATGSILNGIPAAKKYSSFNMTDIFKLKAEQKRQPEQYQVKILIQGFVGSNASFMRSDIVPNGLLLNTADGTKTNFRNFEVVSMDVQTYLFSRVFLYRHHTLRLMRDILGNYEGVLTHKRTPQWFLENYFHGFAYSACRCWSRINSLEDAESCDESSNQVSTSISRPPHAQTHRPRHLRVVHKNEVWSIFASHSKWLFSLVQQHKDLKGEVNGHAWESFTARVPSLQKKALSQQGTNGRWGIQDEHWQRGGPVAGILAPIPSPKLGPPKLTSKKRKQRSKSPPTQPSPKRQSIALVVAGSSTKGCFDAHFDDTFENTYDSDFSQVSTTSCHSSSNTPALDTLALCNLLPPEMFMPPTLPADMVWHCPIGGGRCTYVINLCSPSQDNLGLVHKIVPNDNINDLLHRDWKCNDEQVMMIFYEIVNAHWEEHLRELGIKYVQHHDAGTFESIYPREKPLGTKKWQEWRARVQRNTL